MHCGDWCCCDAELLEDGELEQLELLESTDSISVRSLEVRNHAFLCGLEGYSEPLICSAVLPAQPSPPEEEVL